MSNKRAALRLAFNKKLERDETARFEELKRDIARKQQAEADRIRRQMVRKFSR
jgi:hypothetical protein